MDTRINASLFISPQELGNRLGHVDAPLLLDVRPPARFDASPQMLVGALRCSADDLPAFATALLAANSAQVIVTYCVYGHHVSMDAALLLRSAGLNARALAGGFEGGEEGVDNMQNIVEWRRTQLPKIAKGKS
ncbi:MAG: rhodanese-like domain-containing protein [Polaromonas sp.]|jgi:rhodanese-related sulfurtransferase